MSDWVVVKTYSTRPEADVGKSLLESNKIPVQIRSDDTAGLQPAMSLTSGVSLLVKKDQAAEAKKLLR